MCNFKCFTFGEKSSPNYSKQVKKDSILPEGHLSNGGKRSFSPSLNSTLNIIQAESYSKLLASHQSRASVCLASFLSAPFPPFPPSLDVLDQRARKGGREATRRRALCVVIRWGLLLRQHYCENSIQTRCLEWVLSKGLTKTSETMRDKRFY